MKASIIDLLQESVAVKQQYLNDSAEIEKLEQLAQLCISALQQGNKILLAGNGGSASDAQHIAAELVGRFETQRPGLAAYALNTNASSMTAIANDFSYDHIFARQLQALGRKGDVFLGFSTSGNSPNVVNAIEQARSMGVSAIGLTGAGGGKMAQLCDICLMVPSQRTARVQEVHICIGHILCGLIENHISLE